MEHKNTIKPNIEPIEEKKNKLEINLKKNENTHNLVKAIKTFLRKDEKK